MNYHQIFVSLLLAFLFCNCQTDSNPEKGPLIFADFFIRYLDDEHELKAQASFLEGDSINNAVPKTFEGGIAFQGSGMEMKKIQDKLIRYSLIREMDYLDTFRFKFNNDLGNPEIYSVAMSPIQDFFLQGPISKSKGMTIVINGGVLNPGENLVLLFSDEKNQARTINMVGPKADVEYRFTADQLKNLTIGKGQLYLVKKQLKEQNIGNRVVRTEIEYYTKAIDVEVVE